MAVLGVQFSRPHISILPRTLTELFQPLGSSHNQRGTDGRLCEVSRQEEPPQGGKKSSQEGPSTWPLDFGHRGRVGGIIFPA